jgi:hypothetical protein
VNIIVNGVMGRFSDGVEPTAILVNCHHVTFWQSIDDGHVLIHFLHGSTIEVRETVAEIQTLIVQASGQNL